MLVVTDAMRIAYEHKRFPQAPPKLAGLAYPWRYRKPVDEHDEWRNSVYYYWWEYMRRNKRYRLVCDVMSSAWDSALRRDHSDGIKVHEIELYGHFGNVFDSEFITWWSTYYKLFTDEVSLLVSVRQGAEGDGKLAAIFPYEQMDRVTIGQMVRKAQFYHGENNAIVIQHRVAKAHYRTEMRYVLPNLQTHLDVWDLVQAKPELEHDEIADALKLPISESVNGETIDELRDLSLPFADLQKALRRRKRLAVQRHLRIADQYIRNVMQGKFPYRAKR